MIQTRAREDRSLQVLGLEERDEVMCMTSAIMEQGSCGWLVANYGREGYDAGRGSLLRRYAPRIEMRMMV